MAKARIGRQISLPFSKAFEVAWKGIRIRIWRSLITMSGIILAIAFLMSVWSSGVFTNAMRAVPATHALYPIVQGVLESQALSGGGVSIRCVVVRASDSETAVSPASGMRSSLEGAPGFRAEAIPPDAAAITSLLGEEKAVRPDSLILVGFPSVLTDAKAAAAIAAYVRDGGFLLVYGASGPANAAALADLLPATAQGASFRASGPEVQGGGQLAARGVPWQDMPATEFAGTAGKPSAEALGTAPGGTLVWVWQVDGGKAAWCPVAEGSEGNSDTVSWFVRGRDIKAGGQPDVRNSLLVRLLAYGSREKIGGTQRDTRGVWLVTLSLMVCVVGITNAMLMSVTERYREIGTMKCLGALDIFVVKLFLIESALQGVAGSLAGAVIGFLLAFVRALFTFHAKDPESGRSYWLALQFFPGATLLGWLGVALAVGIALSIIAAVYPAIRAARMEPVQAMRVQE
jgi:hypothetical protein